MKVSEKEENVPHFFQSMLTAMRKCGVIFKVRLSPQGHLFSQYFELYVYTSVHLFRC